VNEPAAAEMFGNVKSRQHGHTRTIRSHISQNLAIIGAECAAGRDADARSAVRERPVFPPAVTAIGKAIVRG